TASLDALPCVSVAAAVITLPPSRRSTPVARKVLPLTTAATPSRPTSTVASGSSTVPSTVMGVVPTALRSAGDVMCTTGGMPNTPSTLAVATLPATSSTRAVRLWDPSSCRGTSTCQGLAPPASTPSTLTEAMPLWSLAVPLTVTLGVRNTEAAAGASMLTLGGGRSMLVVKVAVAWLPARSVALPSAARPVPSPVMTTGSLTSSTPERASVAWKVTVTSVLFQPAALAAGAGTDVSTG